MGGANGVGKTTFYYNFVEGGKIDKSLPFLNVDNIARLELGGYTEENYAIAAELARERISHYISGRLDFMIESNLAKTSDFEWLNNMRNAGYEIFLYFLCTKDILINIDRVEKRVKEGGHFVPAHMVKDRYSLSIIYLKTKLHLFKEIYLIDNTGQKIEEVAVLKDGKIESEAAPLPQWANDLLYIVKRLRITDK